MADSTPLVSIIVPVYNVEEYLGKCLDSLLSQTLENIEIVCVNDSSTDQSLQILKEYSVKDDRIIVVDLPKNMKQGGARNVGMRIARASFFCFVDSDDWIAPNMCENLYVKAIENDADIVCSDYYTYYGEEDLRLQINCNPDWFLLSKEEQNKKFITGECRIYTNIIKKDVFVQNKIQYPEELFYEDNAIVAALYVCANRVIKDNHPYYYYRCTNQSTTRSRNNYRFFDRLTTSKLFLSNMKRLGIYDRYPQEVEFRFAKLFYINSIIGAITQFDPPEKKYIKQIVTEMNRLFPRFTINPYYKAQIPWGLRSLLALIDYQTDFGIKMYKLIQQLRGR